MKSPLMTGQEWALLIALSLLWGGSFFFNEVAVAELPTLTVVAARVVGAAIILLIVCRVAGVRIPGDRSFLIAILLMGLLNNVAPFSLIVWGQSHIASGLAAILNATTPLFTVLAAHLFTADEKLTPAKLFGVTAGLAGVAIMIGFDAARAASEDVLAQLACLLAAAAYAVAAIHGRRFAKMGVSPLAVAAGQVAASSMVLGPAALLIDQPWSLPAPSPAALGALIGVAALSTALAYILYFRLLATAGATNLALVTFLIPVSAIALGAIYLGETLTSRQMIGMAFIGLGLVTIDGRPARLIFGRGGDLPAPRA